MRTYENYGVDEELCAMLLAREHGSGHPERYVLGKSHPDRARQFKPFAALKGYEELVAQVFAEAAEPHDFYDLEEPC